MATKSPNTGGGFPSVAELLDKPPIRALAARWKRGAIAAGVRSFLDELRSDLSRRGAESAWPSLRELAERAARHVVALQQPSERPAINATGRFCGPPWIGRPLCDTALEQAFAAGRDFVADERPDAPASAPRPMMADVPELLCRILAAPAAVAVHSYAGGLWLALSAVAAGRAVVVARAELGVAAPGCSLSDLVASAGAHLEEVGTTNRASVAEYEAAVSSQTAAVLKFCPDAYCIVGDTESAEFEQLVGLTRERELTFIDALGAAPLVDLPPAIPWPHRSARASIAAGTDLAIVHGDGLVGGPACGILAGSRDIIRRITELRMFKAWQLDSPRSAALASSLRCYDEPLRGDVELPLLELLATPLENLRNRADRLAPQLAQAVGIDSAEVVPLQGHWNMAPTPDRSLASFGVALSPADGNLTVLKHRLECGPQPVFCRIEDNRLLLDLRTVFARQDQAIIEAVAGQAPVSAAAPPAPK